MSARPSGGVLVLPRWCLACLPPPRNRSCWFPLTDTLRHVTPDQNGSGHNLITIPPPQSPELSQLPTTGQSMPPAAQPETASIASVLLRRRHRIASGLWFSELSQTHGGLASKALMRVLRG